MKIVDYSSDTFLLLNEPSDLSLASIAAFYRNSLGEINNLIHSSYTIDSTTYELVDGTTEIGVNEVAIYKLIFLIRYYDRQIRNFLGAGSVDVQILSEASADGGTIKFISRNQIASSFIQLKRDTQEQLNKLVNRYHYNSSSPQQIQSDDILVTNTSNRIGSNLIPGF